MWWLSTTRPAKSRLFCPKRNENLVDAEVGTSLNSSDFAIKATHKGRLVAHTAQAEAKRGESRRRHAAGLAAWQPSDQPAWLTEKTYVRKIQPRLSNVTVPAIRAAISVWKSYATNIRSGKLLPHPRHWQLLNY